MGPIAKDEEVFCSEGSHCTKIQESVGELISAHIFSRDQRVKKARLYRDVSLLTITALFFTTIAKDHPLGPCSVEDYIN